MVGKFYDESRGFKKFVPTKQQKEELLQFFDYSCCYCGRLITVENVSQDHLIPMNKSCLGLHAWGNVVPCCKECNSKKQHLSWLEYLSTQAKGDTLESRQKKIRDFVIDRRYDPNLNLSDYAGNLYDDIGAVATTLIELRYKQAEDAIRRIIDSDQRETNKANEA